MRSPHVGEVLAWGIVCESVPPGPLQPPVSIKPAIGITRQPNQISMNCSTSLKMAESNPPAIT